MKSRLCLPMRKVKRGLEREVVCKSAGAWGKRLEKQLFPSWETICHCFSKCKIWGWEELFHKGHVNCETQAHETLCTERMHGIKSNLISVIKDSHCYLTFNRIWAKSNFNVVLCVPFPVREDREPFVIQPPTCILLNTYHTERRIFILSAVRKEKFSHAVWNRSSFNCGRQKVTLRTP